MKPARKALTPQDMACSQTVAAEWPQHSLNAQHHVGSIEGPANGWAYGWSRVIGGKSATKWRNPMLLTPLPVASATHIFVLDPSGCVNAVDFQGNIAWTTPVQSLSDAVGMGGGLVLDDKCVYATTSQRNVRALDRSTGQTIWKKRLKDPVRGSFCLAGNRLYGLNIHNQLIVLDASSGHTLWNEDASLDQYRTMRSSVPAQYGDYVVMGSYGGDIICVDAKTGALRWEHDISETSNQDEFGVTGGIVASPVIAQQRVLVTSENGMLVCLDLETGGLLWSHPLGSAFSPVVIGQTVVMITSNGRCVGLDLNSGSIFWDKMLPSGSPWLGPLVINNMIYALNQKGLLIHMDPYCPDKITNVIQLGEQQHNPALVVRKGLIFYSPTGRLTWYAPRS